jgi:signal transduction histidine kinase/DNA-binding response OmpR family regulator
MRTLSRLISQGTHVSFWQGLRWQLSLAFICLAILPVGIVATITIPRTEAQVQQQVLNQLESVAQLKQNQLSRWLHDSQFALLFLLSGPTKERMIAFLATTTGQSDDGHDINALLRDAVNIHHYAAEDGLAFQTLSVYTPDGYVVAASDDALIGRTVTRQPYFLRSLREPYMQPPYYAVGSATLTMFVTQPIVDRQGQTVGVLAGQLNLAILQQLMLERSGLGISGETYLVSSENNYLLTPSRTDGYDMHRAYHSEGIDRALGGASGFGHYGDYRSPSVPVFGVYRWLPELHAALLAEIDMSEALADSRQAQTVSALIMAVTILLALIYGLVIAARIARPITTLTRAAGRIAGGELDQQVEVVAQNEIGLLANAFNTMAIQLERMHTGLEQRIAERTAELQQTLADMEILTVKLGQNNHELQTSLVERKQAEQALVEERALLARRVEERTADLSAANAELARAARLKDEFLASMSHELRTPLNAVLGLSEALQEELYGPLIPQQQRSLQMIEASGRHLLELINDILDLARIEAGKADLAFGPIAVAEICQRSIEFITQPAHKKRITVAMLIDPSVTTLHGDTRRLKQILANLLSNAVKFTAEEGQIGLEVVGDREERVVRLSVWDTGIGIAVEDLPRLFKPFIQLDSSLARQYDGTGLGLALVARMVELHSGSITVDSTVGKGSRFTIALPWREPLPQPDQQLPLTAVLDEERLAVIHQALIIEDSPTAADQLVRYLHDLGMVSHTHSTGQDAMARAVALRPDVIILDILLPDYSGWEVLAELKTDPLTQAIPVLVISVEDEEPRGSTLGADAYLVKPITRLQLHTALCTLVPQGHASIVPALSAPGSEQSTTRPLVLLAEDNEANITTLSDYLRVKGYRVVVARTGYEAIARTQELVPDVILMDIQMPEMDGLTAIRRIRADETLIHIPIIALTALTMPGDRERCLEEGANAYLSKPVSLKTLVSTLQAHQSTY